LTPGPLYAVADLDDKDHSRCADVLQRRDLELVVPSMVIAEVTSLIARRLGPTLEAEFLRGLTTVEVEAPSPEEWPAIARLVEQYGNFPLGGTDASVAVLAERLGTNVLVTLDRRHFGAIRMSDGRPFQLLPD
jgi:predicted nucleic acid-binding protein